MQFNASLLRSHNWRCALIYQSFRWCKEQLTRSPKARPTVTIAKKPFFELEYEDFTLNDYVHDEFIKFEVAV